MKALWVKDDSGNPTHSFKDRVVAVAASAGEALGFTVLSLRLDRQPRQRGRRRSRARRACARSCSSRTTSSRARSSRPRCTAARSSPSRATTTTSTGSAPRSPVTGALGVRQRQRPAVLRRGLEDRRLRDRRAARLAAAGAGRRPGRVRRRCSPRSTRAGGELVPAGARRAARRTRSSARRRPAARRCRPRSRPGTTSSSPVRPSTIAKSLAIGNPADGPYALDVVRRTGGGGRRRQRRRDRRRHPAARADRGHLRARPPAG